MVAKTSHCIRVTTTTATAGAGAVTTTNTAIPSEDDSSFCVEYSNNKIASSQIEDENDGNSDGDDDVQNISLECIGKSHSRNRRKKTVRFNTQDSVETIPSHRSLSTIDWEYQYVTMAERWESKMDIRRMIRMMTEQLKAQEKSDLEPTIETDVTSISAPSESLTSFAGEECFRGLETYEPHAFRQRRQRIRQGQQTILDFGNFHDYQTLSKQAHIKAYLQGLLDQQGNYLTPPPLPIMIR